MNQEVVNTVNPAENLADAIVALGCHEAFKHAPIARVVTDLVNSIDKFNDPRSADLLSGSSLSEATDSETVIADIHQQLKTSDAEVLTAMDAEGYYPKHAEENTLPYERSMPSAATDIDYAERRADMNAYVDYCKREECSIAEGLLKIQEALGDKAPKLAWELTRDEVASVINA